LAADGPEFETDADVGERHGDQREHEDNEQHVHLVDWPEDGRLPVLETPVTDALDTDLQKDLSAHGSQGVGGGGSRIFRGGDFGDPSERSQRALRGSGLTGE